MVVICTNRCRLARFCCTSQQDVSRHVLQARVQASLWRHETTPYILISRLRSEYHGVSTVCLSCASGFTFVLVPKRSCIQEILPRPELKKAGSVTQKEKTIKSGMDQHPTLGVIRLDYDYPAAPGDVDSPDSYDYPVIFRVVPGLTFQMAQAGQLTDEVAQEFDDAIRWLAEKVSAITGDCGFMMWFQERARSITSTPVFLSSLMQLPTISASLCKNEEKVIIMTANVQSLQPMQPLIDQVAGVMEHQMHYVYVGCEDVEHFGYEVENGLRVDTTKAEPGILSKVADAVAMYPNARAILMECTELPPYSDAVRAITGLPVYDAITNCDFVMKAFLDNPRFGRDAWYQAWNGRQPSYKFGKYLSAEQRRKLVSKPVDEHAMHMIMDALAKTELSGQLKELGIDLSVEQAAHAIADHVEQQQAFGAIKEIQQEMTIGTSSRFRRAREFLDRVEHLTGKDNKHLTERFMI